MMLPIEVREKNVDKVEGDQEVVHHQTILIVINDDIKRAEKSTKSRIIEAKSMRIQTGNITIDESIISPAIVMTGFDQEA